MSRALVILVVLAILAGVVTGAYLIVTHSIFTKQAETYQHRYGYGGWGTHGAGMTVSCANKKIVIILLPGFRWREFYVTYSMFRNKGASVLIACPEKVVYGIREGYSGLVTVSCNVTLASSLDGDALVIIGGPGEYCALVYYLYKTGQIGNTSSIVKLIRECANFLKDLRTNMESSTAYVSTVVRLVQKFYSQHKTIGAICVAPTFLALAGVLHKTKVTMYNAPVLVNYVAEHGGVVDLSESVVVSGNIVTANGPKASPYFARTLVEEVCK